MTQNANTVRERRTRIWKSLKKGWVVGLLVLGACAVVALMIGMAHYSDKLIKIGESGANIVRPVDFSNSDSDGSDVNEYVEPTGEVETAPAPDSFAIVVDTVNGLETTGEENNISEPGFILPAECECEDEVAAAMASSPDKDVHIEWRRYEEFVLDTSTPVAQVPVVVIVGIEVPPLPTIKPTPPVQPTVEAPAPEPELAPVAIAPTNPEPMGDAQCPNGRTLILHAWDLSEIPAGALPGIETTIAAEYNYSDIDMHGNDFPNRWGPVLENYFNQGVLEHADFTTTANLFFDDEVQGTVTVPRRNVLVVNGLPGDKVIKLVFNDGRIESLPVWQRTGRRELWWFPAEWGKFCTGNTAIAVR